MTTAWPHLGAAGTHFATPNPSSGRLAVAWPTSPSSTPSCARSWIVRPPRLSGAVAHSKARFGTSCASSGTRGAKSAAPLERARSTRGPAGAAAAAGRAANAHHFRPRSCTHAHRARCIYRGPRRLAGDAHATAGGRSQHGAGGYASCKQFLRDREEPVDRAGGCTCRRCLTCC